MTMAILRAANAMNRCNEFGPLHIVVADGNVDDDSLDFCASPQAIEPGETWSGSELDCLAKLRVLTETERARAYDLSFLLYRFSIKAA